MAHSSTFSASLWCARARSTAVGARGALWLPQSARPVCDLRRWVHRERGCAQSALEHPIAHAPRSRSPSRTPDSRGGARRARRDCAGARRPSGPGIGLRIPNSGTGGFGGPEAGTSNRGNKTIVMTHAPWRGYDMENGAFPKESVTIATPPWVSEWHVVWSQIVAGVYPDAFFG